MSVYYNSVDEFLHSSKRAGNAKWCEDDANECAKVQCGYFDASVFMPSTPYDPAFHDATIVPCRSIDTWVSSQDIRIDGLDMILRRTGILTTRPDGGYFYNSVDGFVNGDRTMPGVYKQCLYDGNCTEAECVTYDVPAVVTGQRYSASDPSANSVDCPENTELTNLMSRLTTTDGKMQLEGVGPVYGGYAEHPGEYNHPGAWGVPKACYWHGFWSTFNNRSEWVENMGFEHRPIFVRKKDSNQYGWYWHTHGQEYPPTSTNSTEACSPTLRDNCKYQAQIFWCQQGNSGSYSGQEEGDADSKNLMLGRDVLKVEDSENWYPTLCSWCK